MSPGAINRIVNGYPDDHKDVSRTVQDYWSGGETTTFSVGVSFGVPSSGAGINLGISISNDTYKGLGLGLSGGVNGIELSTTDNGAILSASALGVNGSTDFNGNNSIGLSFGNRFNSMGISSSSSGVRTSLRVAGVQTFTDNNNYGKISTSSHGFNLSIPIYNNIWLSVGYSYQRYWIDETDETETYGSLYAKESHENWRFNDPLTPRTLDGPIAQSFDCYAMLEQGTDISIHKDPDWLLGGSFPSYDAYQVTAQGLRGNIQPYIFEDGTLFRKRVHSGSETQTNFYDGKEFTKKVNFRFKNDFSNTFTYSQTPIIEAGTDDYFPEITDATTVTNSEGYNGADQHLAGSKHTEWFSNSDINDNNSPNFVNYPNISSQARTSFQGYDISSQIGGFSITNESGVTYHYGLPVYTYNEKIISSIDSNNDGTQDSWNRQFNETPYAYTWLLTAVTGPDFVDRDNNRFADESDWGYWVTFDYGKWVDDYQWRTPFGHNEFDFDLSGAKRYSYGKKQVYYLDAIKTRSHTALFIKDIRNDAKGVSSEMGGTHPKVEIVPVDGDCFDNVITNLGKSTMKLNKIVLLSNENLEQVFSQSINPNDLNELKSSTNNYSWAITQNVSCSTSDYILDIIHSGNLVLDKYDWQELETSNLKIIKTIELETNYSLCTETSNSLSNDEYYDDTPSIVNKLGKLSLKAISYKGRNNVQTMPPLTFEYDLPNSPDNNYSFNLIIPSNGDNRIDITASEANSDWEGKMVKYQNGGEDYYLLLSKYISTDDNFLYKVLGENTPTASISGTLAEVKNPPFNNKKFDLWGYYKSDYSSTFDNLIFATNSVFRMPTETSKTAIDSWSLREITTSLGGKIKINYEEKRYNQATLKNNRLNISEAHDINTINHPGEGTFKVFESIDLTNVFNVGDFVDVTMIWENGTNYIYTGHHEILEITSIAGFNNAIVIGGLPTGTYGGKGFIDFDCSDCIGNGLQVASIEVVDDDNTSSRVSHFEYTNGTIPYVPSITNNLHASANNNDGNEDIDEQYDTKFLEDLTNIFVLSRELPPPQVLYKNVSTYGSHNGQHLPGQKKYAFQVFEPYMVDNTSESTDITYENGENMEYSTRTLVLKDKTAQIGNLLSVETQVKHGTEWTTASSTNYNYAGYQGGEYDYATYNNQGLIQQCFHEIRYKDNYNHRKGVVSVRKEYPSFLKSTETTSDGISVSTHNQAFDFYTGIPTTVETTNSHNQHFRSVAIPAYEKYLDMGLKVHDINNKNMLSQNTASYSYKIDSPSDTEGDILSSSITTWKDDWTYRDEAGNDGGNSTNIWRKHQAWTWKGEANPDGTITEFIDFDWANDNASNGWIKLNQIELYDPYSKPLEAHYLDGTYAATKLGYNNTLTIASVANAKYTEFAYSGAEDLVGDYFGGEMSRGDGTPTNDFDIVHTGEYCLSINQSNQKGFKFKTDDLELGKSYRISVWVFGDPSVNQKIYIDINGFSFREVNAEDIVALSCGDWHLLNYDFTVSNGGTFEIGVKTGNSGQEYFDDFRFHPIDASMTSYVYDQHTQQVTYILDADNIYTHYEYDDTGRLIATYRETKGVANNGKRLVSKHQYNYQRGVNNSGECGTPCPAN